MKKEKLIAEVFYEENRKLEDFMEEMDNDVFVKYGDITMDEIMDFTDGKEFKYEVDEYNFRCQCASVNEMVKAYGYEIKQFDNNITGVYKTELDHDCIKAEASGVYVYIRVGDEGFCGLVESWGDEESVMEIIEQEVDEVEWVE